MTTLTLDFTDALTAELDAAVEAVWGAAVIPSALTAGLWTVRVVRQQSSPLAPREEQKADEGTRRHRKS